MNKAIHQECFGCGKPIKKAHRIYKKEAYCATCYAREFKNRVCPQCSELARLPVRHPEAICRRCEKQKPCARCGKQQYTIGLISDYGPVCASCSTYFVEEKPCSLCGALSRRLSRVRRLGLDQLVCPRCARADHECCQACGRSRLLADAPDGRRLCQKCLTLGIVRCSTCGSEMPAGYGRVCSACYWQHLFAQRLVFNQRVLGPAIQELYRLFCGWLLAHCGAHRASRLLARYQIFFASLETLDSPLTYELLLERFGAEELRRYRLAVQWLIESHGWVPDERKKLDDSERRSIMRLLLDSSNPQVTSLLRDYHSYLDQKHQNGLLSLRSTRFALSSARQLLERSTMTSRLPEQKDVTAYLAQSPGQAASLHGFITFLNQTMGLHLSLKHHSSKQAQDSRKASLEKSLINMIINPLSNSSFRRAWIKTALAYFHGLPKSVGRAQSVIDTLRDDTDGWVFLYEGKSYWIPKPLLHFNEQQKKVVEVSTTNEFRY